MLEIEEITSTKKLEEFQNSWQALLDCSKCDNLFATYELTTTWLNHFWNTKPILFLLVKNSNKPVALAPFLIDEEKDCLIFPVKHSQRPNLICAENHEEVLTIVLSYLKERFGRIKLHLRGVEFDSPLVDSLVRISSAFNLLTILKESDNSPFLTINTSWQDYLKSKPNHIRHEQKRKVNKIRKAGQVDFIKVSSIGHIDSIMNDILQIERNSWKEKAGKSFTAVPGLKEFWVDLAKLGAQNGWLCIYLLYLNSVPLAHIYGMLYMNKYFALKTSYDESYRHLSPGIALFHYALQNAFQSNLKEFDFLGAESHWKKEFTSDTRSHVDIIVCPRTIRSISYRYYKHKVKPFIKQKAPFIVTLRDKLRTLVKVG
jgi:hypothetical protein